MKEVTIEQIISLFKNSKDEKRMSEIKKAFISKHQEDLSLFDIDIEKQIEAVIRKDAKQGDSSRLKRTKDGKYKRKPTPLPPNPTQSIDKTFEGAAGETAVISELLFREFNANRMMVDKGIDIVATKDNVYRYIQVKTANVKPDGRVYWNVKQERFDAHVVTNLRYVLVARHDEKSKYKNEPMARNMFFVLTSVDIDRGIKEGWINEGVDTINIKVKFSTDAGVPCFYNDKEYSAVYYLNNWGLV